MSFNKTNLQYDSVVPQYVASIERFSSQYGRNRSSSYGAENLIGATTIYPRYGDYMGAFVLVIAQLMIVGQHFYLSNSLYFLHKL